MGLKDEHPIPLSMLSISFLKKIPFYGSYKGKRFKFEMMKDDEKRVILRVYIYKDEMSFDATSIKDMQIKDFGFTKEGIEEGISFVEEAVL